MNYGSLSTGRRSSRSTATGPGSRGGHWGDPTFRSAYFKRWRAEHPEYAQTDRSRRLLAHNLTRLTRVIAGGGYARPR